MIARHSSHLVDHRARGTSPTFATHWTAAVSVAVVVAACAPAVRAVMKPGFVEVRLAAPEQLTKIEPVTAERVSVKKVEDTRSVAERVFVRTSERWFDVRPKNDHLEEITKVLTNTLIAAGMNATRSAQNVNDASITVSAFMRDFHVDSTPIHVDRWHPEKSRSQLDAVARVELWVRSRNDRNVRFVLSGHHRGELKGVLTVDEGMSFINTMLDLALQDAMRGLPSHPSAREAFRP